VGAAGDLPLMILSTMAPELSTGSACPHRKVQVLLNSNFRT
jgi:hypothetical protein